MYVYRSQFQYRASEATVYDPAGLWSRLASLSQKNTIIGHHTCSHTTRTGKEKQPQLLLPTQKNSTNNYNITNKLKAPACEIMKHLRLKTEQNNKQLIAKPPRSSLSGDPTWPVLSRTRPPPPRPRPPDPSTCLI